MPEETGASLVKSVKAEFPSIAIVMVTGRERPSELGDLDIPVLSKPFRVQALLQVVNAELQRYIR